MEEIYNDGLGNTITVKYDAGEDKVTVNNSAIDTTFYEVSKCNLDSGDHIICIENVNDWEIWSDVETRWKVGEFFWNNKINK